MNCEVRTHLRRKNKDAPKVHPTNEDLFVGTLEGGAPHGLSYADQAMR